MRYLILRFLGLSSLATTVICAVIDYAASSGTAALIFRPLGALWLSVNAASLNAIHGFLTGAGPSPLWDGILLPILSQPAIIVFGCLGVFFLALAVLFPGRGRDRHRRLHDDARYDRRGD